MVMIGFFVGVVGGLAIGIRTGFGIGKLEGRSKEVRRQSMLILRERRE